MKIPTEPKPAQLVALVDSREQAPLDLTPLRTETASLPTGDYSLRGLEEIVAIERKSRQDLAACIGRERKRFDREVQRLLAYPVRALVVEATWEEIENGSWRGEVRSEAALGSLLGWIAAGLPVVMAGDRECCAFGERQVRKTGASRGSIASARARPNDSITTT